ncbi:bifunctional prephenate dehydrogenase/3-phosphoshikimate 1-carboxyvinyltransferase, partial [Acinetobacter baumannii]
MAAALTASGVALEEFDDGLAITGSGGAPIAGGATIASHLDHRIAMSMAVAGLAARRAVTIDDVAPVATSFPMFFDMVDTLTA